jgi:hypothetical protein
LNGHSFAHETAHELDVRSFSRSDGGAPLRASTIVWIHVGQRFAAVTRFAARSTMPARALLIAACPSTVALSSLYQTTPPSFASVSSPRCTSGLWISEPFVMSTIGTLP